MEDYERHHAAAWLEEEDLEKRRLNRERISSVNPPLGPGLNAKSQDEASGHAIVDRSSGAIFSVRNRTHSAYQTTTVVPPGRADCLGTTDPRHRQHQDAPTGKTRLPLRSGTYCRRSAHNHQQPLKKWAKNPAFDYRREDRLQRKLQQEEEKQLSLKRPDDLDAYDYQLYYLWPSDEVPMDELINHYGQNVLQELQYGTQSYIELEPSQSLIKVWSFSEQTVRQIALRFGNLLRELIAKFNSSSQMRFVQFPIRGVENAIISLSPDLNGPKTSANTNGVFPLLEYTIDPTEENQDPRNAAARNENRKTMAHIVQQCLKSIRQPQKHVCMRLQMGFVKLGRRMRPSSGRDYYEFSEFEDMLGQGLTQIWIESIAMGGLNKNQLAAISALEMLDAPVLGYSAEFYFQKEVSETESTLMIQHEWLESTASEELELKERKWITQSSVQDESPLEITVVDFDRADYQLRIDLSDIYVNNSVRKSLEKFENNITFRRHPEALTTAAEPQAQSRFLWGQAALQRVVDKTTMTFDIKESTYKFAITRADIFKIDTARSTRKFENSIFEFFIFDTDWDNNLCEFASLGAGQDVSWKRTLSTFFPKPWGMQSDDVKAGFYYFLDVVEEITEQVRFAVQSNQAPPGDTSVEGKA